MERGAGIKGVWGVGGGGGAGGKEAESRPTLKRTGPGWKRAAEVDVRWRAVCLGMAPGRMESSISWEKAAEHVIASNKPDKAVLAVCWDLGATVAAGLMAE